MTDPECRKFIIENWGKIIVKEKEDISIRFDNAYILDFDNIAENHGYCFKEDFNCDNPELLEVMNETK